MDLRMDFWIKGLWILSLAIEFALSAPIEGPRPTEIAASPVEEELLALPKASEPQKVVVKQEEALVKSPDVQPILPENIPPELYGPAGGNGASHRQGPTQNKLKISGYDEVFESPAIDLSPRAVAEYLILTGDFTGFDLALFDLIRARVLSPEEVQRYKEAVGVEYKKMLKQMSDAETSYLQAFNALYGLPSQNGLEAGPQTLLPNPAVVEEKTVQVAAAIGDGAGSLSQPSGPGLGPQPGMLKVEDIVQVAGGRPMEMSNKGEDVELQTLLEWLDNEMRQEMESVVQQPQQTEQQPAEPKVEEEAVKSGLQDEEGDQVQNDTKVEPETESEEGTEGGTLENRDSNGQMVIKNEAQFGNQA